MYILGYAVIKRISFYFGKQFLKIIISKRTSSFNVNSSRSKLGLHLECSKAEQRKMFGVQKLWLRRICYSKLTANRNPIIETKLEAAGNLKNREKKLI